MTPPASRGATGGLALAGRVTGAPLYAAAGGRAGADGSGGVGDAAPNRPPPRPRRVAVADGCAGRAVPMAGRPGMAAEVMSSWERLNEGFRV